MSEEKLTSNKLDIEQKRQSLNNSEDNRESYKQISEDLGPDHVSGGDTVKNSNMVRENLEAQDGADEKMLGSDDKETLALKDVEVKFIAADPNGDAKIEIESAQKAFTGMTKEELMKYANDPFWVKLRWFMFILFWAAWIAMLVGAIFIIINAPKCAPPTPLPWYKEGPLVLLDGDANSVDAEEFTKHKVQGVVYELAGDKTYKIDEVQDKIKTIVDKFKAKNIHVVIDLTPNYVTKDDELLKKALEGDNESLAAFVTSDKKTNFLKIKGGDAWEDQGNNKYYLKQFGDNYDLRLDNKLAQDKLKGVMSKLADIGVKGFRLSNAKHFIIKEGPFEDNKHISDPHGFTMDNYGFYEHSQTTLQPGLGQLLHDLKSHVNNITNDEGFLTIKDDLSNHMENYAVGKFLGFDLPRFGFINAIFHSPDSTKAKVLKDNFDKIHEHLSSDSIKWMQIEYTKHAYDKFDESAFKLFIGLLNGVQIASLNDLTNVRNSTELYTKIQKEHETTVFQHGNFESYLSENNTAFAYSRMKSGNPGYFVVVNPSNDDITAKFNETSVLGSDLTFVMVSKNFGEMPKNKVKLNEIKMPKQSTAIFTFVPK